MKILSRVLIIFAASFIFWLGCGSSTSTSSGTSDGTTGGDSGTGTASVETLAAIPTLDLSSYDSSDSASASIAVLNPSAMIKEFGEGLRDVGNPSRAGCEANMHKEEVIRMSQQVQLSRCYPEAMETAGFFTIPTNAYGYYNIVPPEMEEAERGNMCDGVRAADTEKIEACEAGGAESGSKAGMNMKMRIGRFDNELRIDICEGEAGGTASLVDESTYTAEGAVYGANITHIGNWGGNRESNNFVLNVNLGAAGYVENGLAIIGSDGSITADGYMDGGFGSGHIRFEKIGSDSNRVSGAFRGSFTDPYSDRVSSFTGRVYSRFNADEGCAKFSGTGSMPPMPVQQMIPYDISETELNDFLRSFGIELGINLDSTNYQTVLLCDNPDFNPEAFDSTVKPLVVMSGETCPEVTHSGTECFSIERRTRTTDFGTEFVKSYLVIDPTTAAYYEEVSAYDVSGLAAAITTPAYSRNWDCTGDFTSLDFSTFTAEQMAAAETAMQPCMVLEEEAFSREGMGGYNCNMQEQENAVNDFAETGPEFGRFGGEYGFKESEFDTCPVMENPLSGRLFVNVMDVETHHYCFPSEGQCLGFMVADVDGMGVATLDAGVTINIGGWEVLDITYDSFEAPAEVVVIFDQVSTDGGACVKFYQIEQFDFDRPPEFTDGEGTRPGDAGFIPDACRNVDGTAVPEAVCRDICSDPDAGCRSEA